MGPDNSKYRLDRILKQVVFILPFKNLLFEWKVFSRRDHQYMP
jgi:hypothetical protein